MKKIKILTALNNPKINQQLNQEINYETIGKDIQYKEAILEVLEKVKKIDIIIINEEIPGEINLKDLINKIKIINKKIRIIIFYKKQNNKKEKFFKTDNIQKIYYEENISLKKIKEIIENEETKNKEKNFNIISIFGNKKSGKTFFSILLIKYLKDINKKILIIDLNKNKSKIYFIFKVKHLLKKNIIKINDRKINKIKTNYIIKFLDQILLISRNKYDYIIIDIDSKVNTDIKEQILEKTNIKLMILENKNLGIKELERIVEDNKKSLKNENNGLHIIVNKYNLFYTNIEIIKGVFSKNRKIEKIYYKKIYKNLQKNFKKIKVNKKLKKLFGRILENNKN